jgi:hypothetical protein
MVDVRSPSEAQPKADAARFIDRGDGADWSRLNEAPFQFRHRLADHPLFQIPRMVELVDGVLERGDAGKYAVYGDASIEKLPPKERLEQALLRIEEGATWLKLSSLHEIHPAYDKLLDELLGDVEEMIGKPIRRSATWRGITAFIASPNKVTPYHIDHDTNFLLQVRGSKKIYLFDAHDRSVLTEQEIEAFYLGSGDAAKFREEVMAKAHAFDLTPGTGVHHPPLAPHMVKNGDNVSVSVSFYYSLADLDSRSKVYQMNACMRRVGLHPSPPGMSHWRDSLKAGVLNAMSARRPRTQSELLYSGVGRMLRPVKFVNKLMHGQKA